MEMGPRKGHDTGPTKAARHHLAHPPPPAMAAWSGRGLPPMRVKNLQGKEVDLAAVLGEDKPAVIHFYNSG